ncbi:uncharacterized protein LOC122086296 [Macadamia integrifolia]|uniref:uncharacterized protein LOC122086296 n=1 Tax=Macadamia integrifolia TaxID=60698 RepID=UPI001C4E63B1|nr:uncharacterized protein LOC122086296 [Macadamia integrifolia]
MAAAANLKVRLLVDKKAQKVLFAEAGKEIVDFLFNLLALPVGTVVKLLTKDSMVGSLGNLYKSVENLSESYLEQNQTKVSLLEPKLPTGVAQVPLLLSNPPTSDKHSTPQFYRCNHNCNYVSGTSGTRCPGNSLHQLSVRMTYVVGAGTADQAQRCVDGIAGYVKGLVTYMVKDDLSVTPFSTISGITLLNNFNVREVGSLEEKVFDLDMDLGKITLPGNALSHGCGLVDSEWVVVDSAAEPWSNPSKVSAEFQIFSLGGFLN